MTKLSTIKQSAIAATKYLLKYVQSDLLFTDRKHLFCSLNMLQGQVIKNDILGP